MTDSLQIGQTITFSKGRRALIRFLGRTHFADGDWVGVELDDASGKNDGSVKGERYFDCEMGHGMFIRESAVERVIEQPQSNGSKDPSGKANGQPAQPKRGRPSSIAGNGPKRLSIVDAMNTRHGINSASPTPGARVGGMSSGIRSPTRSPTKPSASIASNDPGSRTGTPPVAMRGRNPSIATSKPRSSMAPPAGKRTSVGRSAASTTGHTARPSVGGSDFSLNRTAKTTARSPDKASATRPSLVSQPKPSQRSPRKETFSDAEDSHAIDQAIGSEEDNQSPLSSPLSGNVQKGSSIGERIRSAAPANGQPMFARSSVGRRPSSPQASTQSSRPATTPNQQLEELTAKLKVMENNRIRDREKLKRLDMLQQERDRYESVIQKLNPKIRSLQLENADLKKQMKESSEKMERLADVEGEHESIVESLTLDREMAKETAEIYRADLETLQSRMNELKDEVEYLREENEELGREISPEEKTSQGWLQMERTNGRLREALLRLRELTQAQEEDMKNRIEELENDVKDLSTVNEEYQIAKEKILQSEADIEDLQQQLEAALGAEEIIEELTERNQALTERIDELNAQIEDLENLKDLNDELEINHVEAEKQMQEEIDFKEGLIIEQNRRAAQQDERLQDYEYTLVRFRQLVTSQQSAIDDMTAARQVTETEAADLNERSKAMMDLNMKLQISASKTQVKTIDLELRRLDAQEAAEHLAIVQLFLPDAFQTERDSVLALLRFKRIAFKAQLIHGFIKEKISNQPLNGHEDDLFAACDVLDKLTWITAMCERFTNSISSCSMERFAKFEGALFELEPIERALNGYIEGLRREELKEQKVAEELHRSMAVMEHLAEIHLQRSVESYADDILMRTLMIQSRLENTATALLQTKAMVQAKLKPHEDRSEEDQNEVDFFASKTENLVSTSRSAKVVVGKALRNLEELRSRSLALNEETEPDFKNAEESAGEIAAFSRALGTSLYTLLSQEGRNEPYSAQEIKQAISSTTSSFFGLSAPEPSLFSTLTARLRSATEMLSNLAVTASDLTLTTDFERAPAPWVLRASALKTAKLTSVDTEELLGRARDDNAAKARELRVREQALDEQAVKIELLEARMKDAGRRTAKIGELERELEGIRSRERELATLLRKREDEARRTAEEREEWRRVAGEQRKEVMLVSEVGSGDGGDYPHPRHHPTVASAAELETLRARICALEAAVRWLRDDNRRARIVEPGLRARADHPDIAWRAPLPRLAQSTSYPLTASQRQQRRRSALAAEGHAVLRGLLDLVDGARPVSLAPSENRLAWRSARTKPRSRVLGQAEDWAAWASWRDDVLGKAQEVRGGVWRTEREDRQKRLLKGGKVAARIHFPMPVVPGEKAQGGEVRIIEPGEFEELRDAIAPV
ncbi:MAG: hypothetical protein M1821_003594 [Bathelium mastoideum]|nr:MAG: hypothetical protein M1821_003594 [Bathelium mastoideum]